MIEKESTETVDIPIMGNYMAKKCLLCDEGFEYLRGFADTSPYVCPKCREAVAWVKKKMEAEHENS